MERNYTAHNPGTNWVVVHDDGEFEKANAVKLIVVKLTLESVSFGGGNFPVFSDDDGNEYPKTQWTPTANYPVCYKRGTKMEVTPKFDVIPPTFTGPVKIKGKSNGPQLPEASTLPKPIMTSIDEFKNTVDDIKPLGIRWTYTVDQKHWHFLGKSENHVYVTLDTPLCSKLFHTVVDVACRNAKGKSEEIDVFNKIWEEFHGRSVHPWQDGSKAMKYWGPDAVAAKDTADKYDTTAKLVKHKDGQCGAWASFMGDVLAAHAINTHQDKITLSKTYPPDCVIPAGFTVYNRLPGQGGMPLETNFTDHQIVKYDGKFYDPSYGEHYNTSLEWEDHSLWRLIYGTKGNYITILDPKKVQDTADSYYVYP